MAAATVDHASAAIGQAAQMQAHGIISHVNAPAAALGVAPGMSCAQAASLLARARPPKGPCPTIREGRDESTPSGAKRQLIIVDSASLVNPGDSGAVIVTGSHGAVFGADPGNALKARAHLALFNDAGGAAVSRLPVLQQRGIAAATVAAQSARIGDGRSTWQDGVISALNPAAEALGGFIGQPARKLVTLALAH
jgi:hypothetical protein